MTKTETKTTTKTAVSPPHGINADKDDIYNTKTTRKHKTQLQKTTTGQHSLARWDQHLSETTRHPQDEAHFTEKTNDIYIIPPFIKHTNSLQTKTCRVTFFGLQGIER